jgi:alpha-amylase
MIDICFIFEVHQPFRLNRNFSSDLLSHKSVGKEDLFDIYFDNELNRHVFERAARKCYYPTNNVILQQIDRFKRDTKKFKVAYSISGVFIEQCERWNPNLLDSFKQLAQTGCVEFLDQTYYHSLASLYSTERPEFIEQVKMHRQLMKDLLGIEPKVFENTECLLNNSIARTIDALGYKAVVTEGTERILNWRSPNHVYKAKGTNLPVLVRNYRLSDDIGFRFSSRWWEQWPLTSTKYASWLAAAQGQIVLLFVDYETFGEHQWPETGIHEFLRWLPQEVIKWQHLNWATPTEITQWHKPVGEVDIHEYNTISWADLERDITAWIGNMMQTICYDTLKSLEPFVKGIGDKTLLKMWRYLQMSDHYYYMSIKGGGPGDVHSYFNPCGSPIEAFAIYSRILADLEARIIQELQKPELTAQRTLRQLPAEKGFTFFTEFARPTKTTVYSIREFQTALNTVDNRSIEFHMERGDFARWIRQVIDDEKLANQIANLTDKKTDDKNLRKTLVSMVKNRIDELEQIAAKLPL